MKKKEGVNSIRCYTPMEQGSVSDRTSSQTGCTDFLCSLKKNANPKPKHNNTQVLITASPGTTSTLPSTFAAQFCDSRRTPCAAVHSHTRARTHRAEQHEPSSWVLSHPKYTGQQQSRENPRCSQLSGSCTASQPPLQTLPDPLGCSNSGPILLGMTLLPIPAWISAGPVQPHVLCLQCPPDLPLAPLPRRVYPLDVFTRSHRLRSRLPFARLNNSSSRSFRHSLAHPRALCPHPPARHIPPS